MAEFQPHVPAAETLPELSLRALALGAVLGVVFGAASTYLALRVGLTVSASVPIAVLAIWAIRAKNGQRAILEHNIVQTTGSAGESVAAAVVFSVPALIFLGWPLEVGLTTLIAITGGCLGVLMMVPLRRYLIVQEHGTLRYPEGKACAEILKAGEKGGTSAQKVFVGLGFGVLFKSLQAVFGGVKGTIAAAIPGFRGAEVASDVAPELMGVGYIIGWRTSLMMVAGSLLASFVLIPAIVLFGSGLTQPLAPAVTLIAEMSPDDIWSEYIKHIGAGAVAAGGVFALARAFPSIWTSLSASLGALRGGMSPERAIRTERDTPVGVLLVGAVAIVTFIWIVPAFEMTFLGAVLILVLGFLFSVVSSRITGEVGSSSCPLSGMTIGVLMATCGIFLLTGREGSQYARLALIVGAVVCIAISNAGTCSQDLKTGFLLGATPVKQQGALLVGVITSVLAVGWTTWLLNRAETTEVKPTVAYVFAEEVVASAPRAKSVTDGREYAYIAVRAGDAEAGVPAGVAWRSLEFQDPSLTARARVAVEPGTYLVDPTTREVVWLREDGIGAGRLKAPQAKLMATVIDGLLNHRLPWDLILLGVAIAVFVELLGFRSLTFAVGVYLPLAATMPVFLGGLVRWIADRKYRRAPDAEDEPEGTLWCSGLIAGASILGILAALQSFLPGFDKDTALLPELAFLSGLPTASQDWFGALVLVAIGALMLRGARPRRAGG